MTTRINIEGLISRLNFEAREELSFRMVMIYGIVRDHGNLADNEMKALYEPIQEGTRKMFDLSHSDYNGLYRLAKICSINNEPDVMAQTLSCYRKQYI